MVRQREPAINKKRIFRDLGRPYLQQRLRGLPDVVYGFANQLANDSILEGDEGIITADKFAKMIKSRLRENDQAELILQNLLEVLDSIDLIWAERICACLGLGTPPALDTLRKPSQPVKAKKR
jgi:hypothetical protein